MHRNLARPAFAIALLLPFLAAAKGQGCGNGGPGTGEQVVPDVSAEWDLEYDDQIAVEITIGGAVYQETVGVNGGLITIDHDGQPFTFDLDCSRPEVVCPSEVWPDSVSMDQRDVAFPRNVYVTIPTSECSGNLVEPDPSECGAGTNNEECKKVCDGEVTVGSTEAFGRLDGPGDELNVLLGAGIATNGINCVMLGLSIATADVETTGSSANGDWTGVALENGEVIAGYAGGCLWVGDPNDDGSLEALVIGGSIKLSTGFTGARN